MSADPKAQASQETGPAVRGSVQRRCPAPSDTPETDRHAKSAYYSYGEQALVDADFARLLERGRAEAREIAAECRQAALHYAARLGEAPTQAPFPWEPNTLLGGIPPSAD